MLGKTNLLFVAEDEPTDLSFTPQYILTPASGDIIKIEIINNLFFVFTSDEKVYFGSDLNSLQALKNGTDFIPAKHIIYADDVYYMTTISSTKGKAFIYKTQDLASFEGVTLKTGSTSNYYPVHGLFLNSAGQIVALIEENTGNTSDYIDSYLLIINTLVGYVENETNFIKLDSTRNIHGRTANYTMMKKDRIFTQVYAGSSNNTTGRIITIDGSTSSCEKYTYYAANYFFKTTNNYNKYVLYYSLNGKDYISLGTSFDSVDIFEYDGNIALVYGITENSKTVTKLVIAATPNGLIEAMESAITVTLDYELQENSYVCKDDYVYLGSTGGILIKAKLDYSDTSRPDITLLKTLSARQALTEANEYTERLFAALETRIEALEEVVN